MGTRESNGLMLMLMLKKKTSEGWKVYLDGGRQNAEAWSINDRYDMRYYVLGR
jgi:hypothetical protein